MNKNLPISLSIKISLPNSSAHLDSIHGMERKQKKMQIIDVDVGVKKFKQIFALCRYDLHFRGQCETRSYQMTVAVPSIVANCVRLRCFPSDACLVSQILTIWHLCESDSPSSSHIFCHSQMRIWRFLVISSRKVCIEQREEYNIARKLFVGVGSVLHSDSRWQWKIVKWRNTHRIALNYQSPRRLFIFDKKK